MCGALAPLDDSSVSILRFQRYDKFREIIAEKSELPGGALACPSAYRRVLDSTRSCGAGSAWHCHFATAVVNEKRSEEAWAISGEGRAPASWQSLVRRTSSQWIVTTTQPIPFGIRGPATRQGRYSIDCPDRSWPCDDARALFNRLPEPIMALRRGKSAIQQTARTARGPATVACTALSAYSSLRGMSEQSSLTHQTPTRPRGLL